MLTVTLRRLFSDLLGKYESVEGITGTQNLYRLSVSARALLPFRVFSFKFSSLIIFIYLPCIVLFLKKVGYIITYLLYSSEIYRIYLKNPIGIFGLTVMKTVYFFLLEATSGKS